MLLSSMTLVALTAYAIILLNPAARTGEAGKPGEIASIKESPKNRCSVDDEMSVLQSLPSCQPRNILVKLPHPKDPDIIRFLPSHVEVARCSGVCYEDGTLHKRCLPQIVEMKAIKVLYERVQDQTTETVCGEVELESHLNCTCDCAPVSCSTRQVFNSRTCNCECTDSNERKKCLGWYKKMWDEERCLCRCKPEVWKECNTGYRYDDRLTCECLPEPTASASLSVTVVLAVFFVVAAAIAAVLGFLWWRGRKQLIELRSSQPEERDNLHNTVK